MNDSSQKKRTALLKDLEPGSIFRKPGSHVKWRKMDRKAVKRGWQWMYWATDGQVERLFGNRTFVFVVKTAESK